MSGFRTSDPRVGRAAEIATRIHEGQRRKGDGVTPYVSHPVRVALYLAEAGLGPDAVAAGLLHDVIEESKPEGREAVRAEIRDRVGPAVLALVEWVTDQKPEGGWQSRKDAYLARLREAPREALAVSVADKLDNTLSLVELIRTQGKEALKRFNSPVANRIVYHRAVLDLARDRWPDLSLVAPLAAALDNLEEET